MKHSEEKNGDHARVNIEVSGNAMLGCYENRQQYTDVDRLWNPGNTRYRTGPDLCKKILFGRKEDRTYRKADEERNQE